MADNMFTDLSRVIEQVGKDKGIDKQVVVEAITQGMLVAARKKYGTYREIDPPERLAYATTVNGEEQTSTTTFTEEDGRTTVITTMRFTSQAARDQALPYAKTGTGTNYARLDAYLASRS